MAVDINDVKQVAEDLGKKFDEFKQANDKRVEGIEAEKSKLAGEVEGLTSQLKELSSLKEDLEHQLKQSGKPSGQPSGQVDEHKTAYTQFLRKGAEDGLAELEQKALNLGTDADGGFAVPEELDRNIIQMETKLIPMRGICNVITVGGDGYRKLVNVNGAASGWVGETDDRTQTNSPKLAEIKPFMGEIYANPQATQKSLDDMFFDVEAWLSSEVALEFAEQENLAFVSGNGTNKPKGFLAYASAVETDAERAFGTLEHMETAQVGAIDADDVVKLLYKLRAGYRMGASFMGTTNTLSDLMILKDKNGQYLWRPGLEVGESSTLKGHQFVENDDMPGVTAGAKALSFGNFKRGYTIVDRMGTRILRDPFTNKPYVGFYTTKRVGGMLTDSRAIKLLKVKAS